MFHTNSTTLLAWLVVFLLLIGILLSISRGKNKQLGIAALFACMGICLYLMYSPVLFSIFHLFGHGK